MRNVLKRLDQFMLRGYMCAYDCLMTNEYANHIIKGLGELGAPVPYNDYVRGCIARALPAS